MSVQDILITSFLSFVESKKGKLCNKTGGVAAFADNNAPLCLNGETFGRTIRTANCELLVHGEKCKPCSLYRRTLHVLYDGWCKSNSDELSSLSSHTNNRYLNTPEKIAKVTNLRQRVQNAEKEISVLKEQVRNLIQKSEVVDEGLHNDLPTIVDEIHRKYIILFLRGHFNRYFGTNRSKTQRKVMHGSIGGTPS